MSCTPELWKAEEQFLPEDLGQSNGWWVVKDGIPIAQVFTTNEADNATRIAAAVNAVAGITTKELQKLGLGGLAKIYADRNQNNA